MTIKDLAAKTGYAVGTVSRALNNHPNVSEKARETILRAADESGFQLNMNAKQLKQQNSNTIAVVVKGIGNELFAEMLEIIQSTPYFDIGAVFNWGEYLSKTYDVVRSGNNNLATIDAKLKNPTNKVIEKFLNTIEKNAQQ